MDPRPSPRPLSRDMHYSQQRSPRPTSYGSQASRASGGRGGASGGDNATANEYNFPASYANVDEVTGTPPVAASEDYDLRPEDSLENVRARMEHARARAAKARGKRESKRASAASGRVVEQKREEDPAGYDPPREYENVDEVAVAEPLFDDFDSSGGLGSSPRDPYHLQRPGNAGVPRESTNSGAPAPDVAFERSSPGETRSSTLHERRHEKRRSRSDSDQRVSRIATQVYTYSYLVFFSIWGTLARIGLQKLTFYPGAPATMGVLWANFAGSFIMGFFAEDQHLFRSHKDTATLRAVEKSKLSSSSSSPRSIEHFQKAQHVADAKAAHARFKKTIPLYIGLTTGFCGSLTSFSSFMRDAFLALSNNLPVPPNSSTTTTTTPRNGGYSLAAVLAVIILTLSLSLGALITGAHFAVFLSHYNLTPTLPSRILRRILDRIFIVLALLTWVGALILVLTPPDAPGANTPYAKSRWNLESWRADALIALVLAPVGCLLRFWLSLRLNGLSTAFPLGTFAANVFGTAVLAACFNLERVPIMSAAGRVGGGNAACAVLQGVQDGFCGALTTVSTFVAELKALRRGHAYVYAVGSVGVALTVVVALMGSVRWGIGWSEPVCA